MRNQGNSGLTGQSRRWRQEIIVTYSEVPPDTRMRLSLRFDGQFAILSTIPSFQYVLSCIITVNAREAKCDSIIILQSIIILELHWPRRKYWLPVLRG